jgi:hypothetical protein
MTGVPWFDPRQRQRIFSLACVQTSSRANLASYPMVTRDPFPGVKGGRDVTLTTHPHFVPRSRMYRSYTSFPVKRVHGVWWDSFSFSFGFSRSSKVNSRPSETNVAAMVSVTSMNYKTLLRWLLCYQLSFDVTALTWKGGLTSTR